ncbi:MULTISPECIES: hypothetical protein [Streptomyces]|uniref:hypothetical protein n=1 Tax=Streptomyces TaxID=1883 RepID=UPI0022583CA7|nr:hypothetical protein [Streptomyces sp. NBC_01285]MCX4768320.1 hypothetical protein [Streptomyces sp. NBC_01285]
MTVRPGPWWRWRVGRFTAHWPTRLPGIRFFASGTLTHLVPTRTAGTHHRAAARAAARLALDEIGRGIVGQHQPEELEHARQKLTLAISPWQYLNSQPGQWFRARLTLQLPQQDADLAQKHQNVLRDVELQLAQDRLRRQELARTVCADRDAARLWWLERHLDGLSALDWAAFQDAILPLVGTSVIERTEAERLAHTLLYIWERLDSEPGRQTRFTATARRLFEQMGWADGFPWPAASDDLEPLQSSPTTAAAPLTTENEQ